MFYVDVAMVSERARDAAEAAQAMTRLKSMDITQLIASGMPGSRSTPAARRAGSLWTADQAAVVLEGQAYGEALSASAEAYSLTDNACAEAMHRSADSTTAADASANRRLP